MKFIKNLLLLTLLITLSGFISIASAQSTRSLINEGVELYSKGKYADSEVNFMKGVSKDKSKFEGHFNLGDAYYKQGRYDEALKSYMESLKLAKDDDSKAGVYHNVGNALLKTNKLKESIGAYKNALKLNPDDNDTKYNLSYALQLMKNEQQQKQQPPPQQKQQQQNQQKQQLQKKDDISKKDTERILEALKNKEAELQKEARKNKGKVTKKAKDW